MASRTDSASGEGRDRAAFVVCVLHAHGLRGTARWTRQASSDMRVCPREELQLSSALDKCEPWSRVLDDNEATWEDEVQRVVECVREQCIPPRHSAGSVVEAAEQELRCSRKSTAQTPRRRSPRKRRAFTCQRCAPSACAPFSMIVCIWCLRVTLQYYVRRRGGRAPHTNGEWGNDTKHTGQATAAAKMQRRRDARRTREDGRDGRRARTEGRDRSKERAISMYGR